MKHIFKKINLVVVVCCLAIAGVVGTLGYSVSSATTLREKACEGVKVASGESSCDKEKIDDVWVAARDVINWVLVATGIVCVVFIIIGGIKFATSGGDTEKVKTAKNTVLYAVIGLALALLAGFITNVVFDISDQVQNTPTSAQTLQSGIQRDPSASSIPPATTP
ncbi:MAG: pilin [Candidatus Nomurabacteria bacterium]|jgi:Flp pilus assembly protein CpaB|nr:pilin [Candidatus Nomurabacteria bacterium]